MELSLSSFESGHGQSIFEDAERLGADCEGEYSIPWTVFHNPPRNLERSTKRFRECYHAGKAKFDADPASKTLPERVAEMRRLSHSSLNSRINVSAITGRVSRDEPNPCASFVL